MTQVIITEKEIKHNNNPHVKKWRRMSPVDRLIKSLESKKETRINKIIKLQEELKDITSALNALYKRDKPNE